MIRVITATLTAVPLPSTMQTMLMLLVMVQALKPKQTKPGFWPLSYSTLMCCINTLSWYITTHTYPVHWRFGRDPLSSIAKALWKNCELWILSWFKAKVNRSQRSWNQINKWGTTPYAMELLLTLTDGPLWSVMRSNEIYYNILTSEQIQFMYLLLVNLLRFGMSDRLKWAQESPPRQWNWISWITADKETRPQAWIHLNQHLTLKSLSLLQDAKTQYLTFWV